MLEVSCDTCTDEIGYDGEKYVLIVRTSEWDYYNDWWKEEHIPINYCPECGRKYIEDDKN